MVGAPESLTSIGLFGLEGSLRAVNNDSMNAIHDIKSINKSLGVQYALMNKYEHLQRWPSFARFLKECQEKTDLMVHLKSVS